MQYGKMKHKHAWRSGQFPVDVCLECVMSEFMHPAVLNNDPVNWL